MIIPIALICGVCYLVYKLVSKHPSDSVVINKSKESFSDKEVVINQYLSLTNNNGKYNIKYKNENVGLLSDFSNDYPQTYNQLNERINDIKRRNIILKQYSFEKENVKSFEDKIDSIEFNKTADVYKPSLSDISEYDTRFDGFTILLKNIDYKDNNSEYVNGHKKAIKDQYKKAYELNDLNKFESIINEEIANYSSQTLSDKGYYDGMMYVLKAVKKSKELIFERINNQIKSELY